jgi:hypothetical protein
VGRSGASLKLAHSPAADPRNGWRATVREHRARLELQITPRLRQTLQDELERVYGIARRNAEGTLRDHGDPAAADALPATCPTPSIRSPPTGGREHPPAQLNSPHTI